MKIRIYFSQSADEAGILSALNVLELVDHNRVYDPDLRAITLVLKDLNATGLCSMFPTIERIENVIESAETLRSPLV